MTKKEILESLGYDPNNPQDVEKFYAQYPTKESWTESYKKGGWIQKATASIKRRGTEGKCTPMSKPGCTGRALALAKTFHKMAAKRKKKEDGGVVDAYQLMGMPTPAMYGMGGTTNIGDLSHVISAKNFPNMGYAMGGSIPMYGFGSIVKDIGAAAYGVGEGMLDTLSMGATDQLTDQGYKVLQDLGGSSEAEKRQQDSIRGYGTTAGAITMGIINPLTATSAVKTGAEGLGQGIAKGSPKSQLAQSTGMGLQALGNTAGMVGGQMYTPNVPQAAMGGQVNYPEGYQKNITFAMGGMTGQPTEINVEKGELLIDPKTNKILTKYLGGGMVPHPKKGIDKRGTVIAKEGDFVIPKKYAPEFVAAKENNNILVLERIKNNTVIEKAQKEAKDAQIAAVEEQKANKAMNRIVAKYGGAIKRMYARGGMVPMYGNGAEVTGPRVTPFFNFPDNNYFGNFPDQIPYQMEGNEGWGFPASMTNPVTGFSNYLNTMRQQGIRNNQDVTIPTYARQGVDADGNPVSINPNAPSGYIPPGFESMDAKNMDAKNMSNFGKYAPYVMQGLPIAWNLMQSMKKPTKVPGTLGAMSTALEAPKMSGEAGRRALGRESAAARYAWKNAGAQSGSAALTALTNARMSRIADYEEALRNAQAQMDYQAATQRKAYEQFNAQQAMNRYMLQAQADAVPTQYASAGMGQLGQMGESILNRQALKELYG